MEDMGDITHSGATAVMEALESAVMVALVMAVN